MRVTHYDSTQQISTQYQYRYDALNRRTTKRFVHTQDPAQNYSHHYLYDGNAIIAILDHEQNLLSTLTHADSTDTPLSITNELTAETYYYHTDHQGSITHLTNSIGEIVETFAYDGTYGTITEHHKTEETYNPYCYTGREFDSKELYYYRARYYDPTIGRFISQDPIEFLAGDFNFYRYVGNDPVNWVDPSGLRGVIRPPVRCRTNGRGRYRVPGTRPIEESLPPAEYIPISPNTTGEPMITAPRPYRTRPYMPVIDPEPNPVIYPRSSARIEAGKESEPEACPEPKESATRVTTGAQIYGEGRQKPKCKEICFSVSTKDYPNIKDVNGKTVPRPPSGQKKLPAPYKHSDSTVYRTNYTEENGAPPSGAQVHHILPGWAGGSDNASNLVALTEGHTGEGSLHRWWNDKLKEKTPELNQKMAQCAKQNGATGSAISQCQIGVGNKFPVGSGSSIRLGEGGIPKAAACLEAKGVNLEMAIDKPCTK